MWWWIQTCAPFCAIGFLIMAVAALSAAQMSSVVSEKERLQ